MSARRIIPVMVVFALLPASETTWAGPAPPTRAPAVQAVMDCRKLTGDAERLACFDKAAATLAAAEESGDLVSIDRNQREQVRRQAFGFALPSLELFDRGQDRLDSVKETLASASQDYLGHWTFVMKDGQVWRQIDNDELTRKPHPGSSIEIRRAMLGSFMLSVDGQPGVRAHRDN